MALAARPRTGGSAIPSAALDDLLGQVSGWTAPDDQAASVQALAKQLVLSSPGLEYREHPGVHLTASAVVYDSRCRRFLLLLHPKYKTWLQPGGHCDGDTDLAGVAAREVAEECGLDSLRGGIAPIDINLHEGEPGAAPHMHVDVRFLMLAPDGSSERQPVSPEGHRLRWFEAKDMPSATLGRLARIALVAHRSFPG